MLDAATESRKMLRRDLEASPRSRIRKR